MIDFRYHLVSLISVFVALAVGIVLGAGPLNEPIARGLTQRVQQLQDDRDAKADQLRTAQVGITNRDTFITQMQPGVVADQLGGRSVVLVTLPGFDPDAVKPVTTAITEAGAKVTGRVDVQNAWVDPSDASAREKAIQALAVGGGRPAGLDGDADHVGRFRWIGRVGRHPVADALGWSQCVDPARGRTAAGSRHRDHRTLGEREDGLDREGADRRALACRAHRGHR